MMDLLISQIFYCGHYCCRSKWLQYMGTKNMEDFLKLLNKTYRFVVIILSLFLCIIIYSFGMRKFYHLFGLANYC